MIHRTLTFSGPRQLLASRAAKASITALLLLASNRDIDARQSATEAENPKPQLWQALERSASECHIGDELKIVADHMAEVARSGTPQRTLARVRKALGEPWTAPSIARDLRDLLVKPIARSGPARFDTLVSDVAAWLDFADFSPASAESSDEDLRALNALIEEVRVPELVGVDLMKKLSELMGKAHDTLQGALARLDEDDQRLLFAGHGDFCECWYRLSFPNAQVPLHEQQKKIGAYLAVLSKLDRQKILGVASALVRLTDPDFDQGLVKRLVKTPKTPVPAGFTGDIIAVAGGAPKNRVVLGGSGMSKYAVPAALVIDLGGDDVYSRAAVVDGNDMLASVVIDLGGNDIYRSEKPGPAYAVAGVAILLDRQGKDRYESHRLGQASSAGGFALLADLDGDDHYEAEDYVQGYTLCGVSLLYDQKGKDTYDAWAYAQGAGIGYGFSALVDGAGNDRYLADLRWPDVYGDSGPNVFGGYSQGYAAGIRPETPGGFAALIDRSGSDRYQAGNFSQGGGYYFGFGLMEDGGGNDENFGTRYSQGFGVHQAVGIRWDEKGNDTYTTRSVANCGSAWDEGVGYLIDDEGDDVYQAGGLSLGSAANTAIAVLFDGGGNDKYRSGGGGDTQGGTGDSSYHKLPPIGFLIDLGSSKDQYSRPGRDNNRLVGEKGGGIFLDSPAKTLQRLLRGRLPTAVLAGR